MRKITEAKKPVKWKKRTTYGEPPKREENHEKRDGTKEEKESRDLLRWDTHEDNDKTRKEWITTDEDDEVEEEPHDISYASKPDKTHEGGDDKAEERVDPTLGPKKERNRIPGKRIIGHPKKKN